MEGETAKITVEKMLMESLKLKNIMFFILFSGSLKVFLIETPAPL